MNRNRFLKNVFGVSLFSLWGFQANGSNLKTQNSNDESESAKNKTLEESIRQELTDAWLRSEKMTMVNIEQMPANIFTFKYTEEAMTFSEQWRHCVMYTCSQLSGRTGVNNPYKNITLPVQMPKEDVIKEMKNMYAFVRKTINELPSEKLFSECSFANDTISVWRLFYALENHIIHHRGQCVVYLRLKGVIPKGYYGW